MNFCVSAGMTVLMTLSAELPMGKAPPPVSSPHFPDRLCTFVWRNWPLVPVERMAKVVHAQPADILQLGKAMGLANPPAIPDSQWRRSYLTVIRRNWHLLPYEQLLQLLDWTPEQMAFTLREDDFFFVKLGLLKPKCDPLVYREPDPAARQRMKEIATIVLQEFPAGFAKEQENLFRFVDELSAPPVAGDAKGAPKTSLFSPRYCYSYFALYGDPLLDLQDDPYPDGYLARLAAAGVDGVWLQAVLYKLSPFPWDPKLSDQYEKRLENLRQLVAKARRHGIGLYLYLNEPRAMPLDFFASRGELKGVVQGDHAALCTSVPAVQDYLTNAVAMICKAVPDLAGFFTITASENFTNCWSHHQGAACPRCGPRGAAVVISEVNGLFQKGIEQAVGKHKLIAWDWGWADSAADATIAHLPAAASFMSVSEWGIPFERGGVKAEVGEYSISVIGPGERARHRWKIARERGMQTIAKMQVGNTWEMAGAPYIPAVANVAKHAVGVREAGVNGVMLGWTLGGYPSPNLEVVAEIGQKSDQPGHPTADEALERVALRRFGAELAPEVVKAWKQFSSAFREFPYHPGTLYNAPLHAGASNPLWAQPTGYRATMVGIPYDDLNSWRMTYPPKVFIDQLEKVVRGFEAGIEPLTALLQSADAKKIPAEYRKALSREIDVARASAIHFQSVANQARFVVARDELAKAKTTEAALPLLNELEQVLKAETDTAKQLYMIQSRDSRIGFEASNQYFYVPIDLIEKVVNCRDLLERWLPAERRKWER